MSKPVRLLIVFSLIAVLVYIGSYFPRPMIGFCGVVSTVGGTYHLWKHYILKKPQPGILWNWFWTGNGIYLVHQALTNEWRV